MLLGVEMQSFFYSVFDSPSLESLFSGLKNMIIVTLSENDYTEMSID